MLSLLLLVGCDTDTNLIGEKENNVVKKDTLVSDELNETDGDLLKINFEGRTLQVKEFGESYLFEGDILISKKEIGESKFKSAARVKTYWWDNNTVPYTIDSNLPMSYRVVNAIAHWEENTNLKFIERTNEVDYVTFEKSTGCAAHIGKIGGEQKVFLADGCTTGSTIHEIGHAVGLWHEQSRIDRDEYITILWDNIKSGTEYNFETYSQNGWWGIDITENLDFSSIMLYDSYAFSKNGLPTIVKNNGYTYNSNRRGLSYGDIVGANIMYPSLESVYENGNYYTVNGLKVYRYNNKWFFLSSYGWYEVEQRENSNGEMTWYYGKGGANELPDNIKYINGQTYFLYGITVLRQNDEWYYDSPYGLRKVILKEKEDGTKAWYYSV